MPIQTLLAILLWNGPATTAEILRTLRSFNEPNIPWRDRSNWDHNHHDLNWPGFITYLEGRDYDTSKVGANIRDPVQDKNVILDSEVEDTEECKRLKPCL